MSTRRYPTFELALTAFSPEQQEEMRVLIRALTTMREKNLELHSYTNSNRPAAGNAGVVIFNTDDGQMNIDDGTNWTLPDGTTT